jgi:hypothetical protein
VFRPGTPHTDIHKFHLPEPAYDELRVDPSKGLAVDQVRAELAQRRKAR